MKKNLLLLVIMIATALVTYAEDKIAVVNLSQIVEKSSQVQKLKQEHMRKIADLDKIVINARGEISAEKDPQKILLLEDKYMKEFNTKKNSLEKEYNTKLSDIEKNIKAEVTKKALALGYKYVFAKSVVLYGGDDITSELLKIIK